MKSCPGPPPPGGETPCGRRHGAVGYGADPEQEKRYSPPACVGAEPRVIQGNPDPKHISTSYVERQNLTMRMSLRRFTRLTNAHSRKIQNHGHAVALHFVYYNFCRRHMTLGMTPAMAAGLADHEWSIEELVGLLEERENQIKQDGGT